MTQIITKSRTTVTTALLCALFVLLTTQTVTQPVVAQSPNESQPISENCEELGGKLEELDEKFEERRELHVERYQTLSQLFNDLTLRLNEAGFDTVLLEELHPGLERRVNSFVDRSLQFQNSLGVAAEATCEPEAEFEPKLTTARENLRYVNDSVRSIRTFVTEVVIPSIQSVLSTGTGI